MPELPEVEVCRRGLQPEIEGQTILGAVVRSPRLRLPLYSRSLPETAEPRFLEQFWRCLMARVCQVTGKGPMVGNNVSHANNKTKRRFLPNLPYRRFWLETENRWVRLRVTNAALRLIDKVGIEQVVADLRARGEL